jgi:hypothetical protein
VILLGLYADSIEQDMLDVAQVRKDFLLVLPVSFRLKPRHSLHMLQDSPDVQSPTYEEDYGYAHGVGIDHSPDRL